jgi:hypothetical protein
MDTCCDGRHTELFTATAIMPLISAKPKIQPFTGVEAAGTILAAELLQWTQKMRSCPSVGSVSPDLYLQAPTAKQGKDDPSCGIKNVWTDVISSSCLQSYWAKSACHAQALSLVPTKLTKLTGEGRVIKDFERTGN